MRMMPPAPPFRPLPIVCTASGMPLALSFMTVFSYSRVAVLGQIWL